METWESFSDSAFGQNNMLEDFDFPEITAAAENDATAVDEHHAQNDANAHVGSVASLMPAMQGRSQAETHTNARSTMFARATVVEGPQSEEPQLRLLQYNEWDKKRAYDENTPTCILYTIEWKAVLRTTVLGVGTEQAIPLAPGVFWRIDLRKKIERLLDRKYTLEVRPKLDDTTVVASVKKRSVGALTKQFVGREIDRADRSEWLQIEHRMNTWEAHFRAGAAIVLRITCKFRNPGQRSDRRGARRGRQTATQEMQQRQERQRDAEEFSSDEQEAWRKIYAKVYCTRDCGPRCWEVPVTRKHIRLLTDHLRQLVKWVRDGNRFESHEDMPDHIRQELFAEDQQRAERRSRSVNVPTTNIPAVHINNVLPSQFEATASNVNNAATGSSRTPTNEPRLKIAGLRDAALKSYVRWHQSKGLDKNWAAQYERAGEIVMQKGYRLEKLHENSDTSFLTREGIEPGIAQNFVEDIPEWYDQYECE